METMKRTAAWIAIAIAVSMAMLASASPARALGPVDGEAGIFWWANDFEGSLSNGDIDAGALGGYGELWLGERWGMRGSLYRSDLEDVGLDSSDHIAIDLKRRFLSATDNTFFALGLGWEDIDLESGESTSGARLMAEGRVGLAGAVYFYGQTAWIPDLDDVAGRTDIDGREYEIGVVFDPLPFLSLRAGYRRFRLDFDDATGSDSQETKGFLLGAGVHW
jgi:hypothetical protein